MKKDELKKELHKYIEEADDALLKLIHKLFLIDKQMNEIPDWMKELLDERLKEYELNPDDVISWKEVEANIEKMKNNKHKI